MKMTKWAACAAMLGGLHTAAMAAPSPTTCDRACLSGVADKLLASMSAHDPSQLSLAREYRATENGVASGLPMMNAWNTVTATGSKYYVIDPVSGQIFFVAELKEGQRNALGFGRLKVVNEKLSEIELYISRSRGDTGYQFSADHVSAPAPEWTAKVDGARLPARPQLLAWGKSIFDSKLPAPPTAPNCVLMENGKVVEEDAEVAKQVSTGTDKGQHGHMVNIPCGAFPDRPTDPLARTDIVDEEQGVVVSIATVHGVVQPSLVENPTISAFVPDSLLPPYLKLLAQWKGSSRAKLPAVMPTRASIAVAEMHRYYDGKLQGMYMLEQLGAPGSHSPWVQD
jgi:hypothetical protein